jgi:hypothetical protein
MIQLNNVSSALSSTGSGAGSNSLDPSSLISFESALSDAVTQTLQKFGINPNSVNISIAAAPKTSASSNSNPTAAPLAPSASSLAGLMTGAASSTTPPLVAAPKAQPAEDPVQSFDDKYWAKQPGAVQALRSTEDFAQRTQMAMQLAQQGYSIDVPIMVWGWDPSQVTSSRQSYGYTWVPSALQNPIESAPGIKMQGMQAYDPNNPPAGSITV